MEPKFVVKMTIDLVACKALANVNAKDSFVQGDASSFVAFIEQKTGLVAKKY